MNFLRRRNKAAPTVALGTDFGKVGSAEQWGLKIMRGRTVEHTVHHGPNAWHAMVTHADGTYTDLGVSYNLLTNAGRDLIANTYGHAAAKDGAFTATSATSATPAGGGMTVDGYKGWRVYAAGAAITTAVAYGNVGSNSATVLTIDQWWTAADGTATTPAATNGYIITPSATSRFMGVSAEGTAPAAGDTTLATEQTANGLGRAIATYAHTGGTATYTLQKSYSVTGSVTVHKGALFTAANTTAAGIMVFAANLNADAIVASGDTLTVTATCTLT